MEAGGTAVTGDGAYRDPRWNWPEYEPGAVVELRIHGVGGEGPEGMTRDPHPVRVGGDDGVGFWRARNPEVPPPTGPVGREEHADPPDPTKHVREVVSWGGSTSGSSRSAFWVLLLPFALFNAAGRMVRPGASDRRVAVHQAICRVLALSMTVAVVALTMSVVVDLVAVQCGALPVCREADLIGRWLLAPLRVDALIADAAALVALLALLPVVAVYLLRIAGRREVTHIGRWRPAVELGNEPAQRLDEPDFWHNLWPTWRLRGIHITAGYGWTVLVLATVLPPLLPDVPGWVGPTATAIGAGALAANAIIAALPRTAAAAPDATIGGAVLALRAVTLVALGTLVGTALSGALTSRIEPWFEVVLVATGALALLWALQEHARHVLAPDTAGSGPSGAVRDAVTALGAVALALVGDLAGEAQVHVVDALPLLTGEAGTGDWLLGGAPQAVYRPLGYLVIAQVVLLVALAAVSLGPSDRRFRIGMGPDTGSWFRTDRGPLPTSALPWNAGAPVVALLSLLLVTAIGSGLHGAVLDWLGDRADGYAAVEQAIDAGIPVPTSEGDGDGDGLSEEEAQRLVPALVSPRSELALALPWWQPWTAIVVALTLALFAGATGVAWWRIRRETPTDGQLEAAADRSLLPTDDQPDPNPEDGAWADEDIVAARDRIRAAVVRSWRLRVLTERAGWVLLVAVMMATLTVMAGATYVFSTGEPPAEPALASLWMLGLAAVPGLAVAAIRTAREDRGVRRQLGRLWDVLAFWPRLTHPFAPPSYGEALVPAVAARVEALAGREHPVILAGHSQGSIVAVATALQLPPGHRHLHLVTYGSPVRLLYEGFFPFVFGGDEGAIALATPSGAWPDDPEVRQPVTPPSTWHNVLALSEPIGTPLWQWSVDDDVATGGDGLQGWDALLTLPWAACDACGWNLAEPPEPGTPPPAAIDCTITDPDRIMSPAGEVDGVVAGHSSYHRSRELDLHLSHLAAMAAGPAPDEGPG